MNKDIMQGKWKEIKGKVQSKWGRLTDDHLDEVEGDTERLAGVLQKQYGYTKERAKREVNEFFDSNT